MQLSRNTKRLLFVTTLAIAIAACVAYPIAISLIASMNPVGAIFFTLLLALMMAMVVGLILWGTFVHGLQHKPHFLPIQAADVNEVNRKPTATKQHRASVKRMPLPQHSNVDSGQTTEQPRANFEQTIKGQYPAPHYRDPETDSETDLEGEEQNCNSNPVSSQTFREQSDDPDNRDTDNDDRSYERRYSFDHPISSPKSPSSETPSDSGASDETQDPILESSTRSTDSNISDPTEAEDSVPTVQLL